MRRPQAQAQALQAQQAQAQQAQQLQAQQEQLHSQQHLVQQLTQALAASHTQAQQARLSVSPTPLSPTPQSLVFSTHSTANTSPTPQADGMFIHGEWQSREQLLRIYALRSKQTCGSGPMDQAAAGRSMVVASIFHLPSKTIRGIWARQIGAEWTCSGWTERERHLHMNACAGNNEPGEEQRQVGSKYKVGRAGQSESAKIPRKPESEF